VLACALVLAASGTYAQDPPTFAIRGYQIEGNSLLPQDTVSITVMPFTGPKSSFETIQSALEALERAYLKAGYGSVKIEVPEQDLKEGVVRLLVVEARLAQIAVEPGKFHGEANIRRSLPALVPGQVVNVDQLQRNLDLANESFAKHTSVTFRQSESSPQTDAIVRVQDDDPTRFIVSLDNTGNLSTGRYRLGLSYLHANLFDRDHSLSAQVLTSPTRFDRVAIVGVGYRIPLYEAGLSADITLGYSNVDSGQISLFSVSGSGLILGARLNQPLRAIGDWQHRLSYGIDQRNYGNSVVPVTGGTSLVPSLRVHPVSIGYSGSTRSAQRDLAAAATLSRNIPGGRDGSTAAFNQPGARTGADAAFTVLKFNGSWTERFSPDWSLRASLAGQLTPDLLISAEQFGAGGSDSVRGFSEREVSADRGLRASFEVTGPDLARQSGTSKLRLQPVVFVDSAWVRFNQAPGAIQSQTIASVGLGLRASYERQLSMRLDLAQVVKGAQATAGAATATRRGDWRLHGSAMWIF
jgi:hemolysin activation/secretion protein